MFRFFRFLFGHSEILESSLRVTNSSTTDLELRRKSYVEISSVLSYLRGIDVIRYNRVRKYIKRIWITESVALASYIFVGKLCIIDFSKIPSEGNREYRNMIIAAVLVHEATHGKILSHKYLTLKSCLKENIEEVCNQESIAFLKKTDNEYTEFLTDFFKEL